MVSPKTKDKLSTIFTHLALIILVFLIASPILFALIASTQSTSTILNYPPQFLPGNSIVRNFTVAWNDYNLGRLMLNSTIIAIAVTVGKTIISILAAMALVYFDFPFKSLIFVVILLTLLLPVPVRIVSLFEFVSNLGLADTYYAMIFPFFASATGTFLFRQHFQSIPDSLTDAARVDGAGPIRFMTQVLVPMSMNTIGALAVIQFIYMWNQYLWPLIIMQSENKQVIQLGLKMLTGSGRAGVKPWGPAMAGSIIAMLPPLLIFLLLQEQFMKGFALKEDK
ncbi:MAG: carbohydrate ABC transporter permease [Candidatus Bipolaricaulia bacterium]